MANILSPPTVVGPVSPCNTSIRVQNQLIGATVDILQNGNPNPIAEGVASWTDQTFNLNAGVVLNPNDEITARQVLAADTSGRTPVPVLVQQKPAAPLGPVTFAGSVLACANALPISGAVPGAQITLTDATNHIRGSGVALQDGSAIIGLNPQLRHGEILKAVQSACGLIQPVPTQSPIPALPPRLLPMPVVHGPLYECDRAVTVANVIPGAVVTLSPTLGPTETAGFAYSQEYFIVPPLKLGERVAAQQDFPKCDVKGGSSLQVTVGPPQAPTAPFVVGPLCPGAQSVRLTGLTIGATIQIFQNGTQIAEAGVAKAIDDFYVPTALLPNAKITAKQSNQCPVKQWSGPSNIVIVDPVAAPLDIPRVTPPLFACASIVHVEEIHAGALVEVLSAMQGVIGSKHVYAYEADINVAPQLTTGDKITVRQSACGKVSGPSLPVVIQALPDLKPPVVEPLNNCMRSVRVSGIVPGAFVDVFVVIGSNQKIWLAGAMAGTTTIDVPLQGQGELTVGETIVAQQRLCTRISGFVGKGVTVTQGLCSYVTQHFDNARTGWNRYESALTVDSVLSGFGQIATLSVNGQVFGQPLYLRDVTVPGLIGKRNLLFVVTATDWIYAFDADTYQDLWPPRQLIPQGGSPLPYLQVYKANYYNIRPFIGIVSTPAIDPKTNTAYLVATGQTAPDANGNKSTFYHLHAIDLTTGQDRAGSPVSITAQYPANAGSYDPLWGWSASQWLPRLRSREAPATARLAARERYAVYRLQLVWRSHSVSRLANGLQRQHASTSRLLQRYTRCHDAATAGCREQWRWHMARRYGNRGG